MKNNKYTPDIYEDDDYAPRHNTRSPKQRTKADDGFCAEDYNPKNARQSQYDKRRNGAKRHTRRDDWD